MVTVGYSGVERTYLQAVNNIILLIGENQVVSLANTTRRIQQAMNSVVLARDEIFYHTMWKFRRDFLRIELAENTMWYELPADFEKMATGFSMNREDKPDLTQYSYEKMCDTWPDLRAFPPGNTVTDLTTLSQLLAQNNFGTPDVYCIENGYVGLMPIPDSDFVDLEGALYASYWKHAHPLTSDQDDIGLPRNLWTAHQQLSLGYLKESLEFQDWRDDKTMGIASLSREASGAKSDPDDMQLDQENFINYNE